MEKARRENLIGILTLSETDLFKYAVNYLKDNGYSVYYRKGYYILGLPVDRKHSHTGIVAHLDTASGKSISPENILMDKDMIRTNGKEPLGADDRAGVFAIFDLIEAGYRPVVILTCGEETGGTGANALVNDIKDLRKIIEVDFLIELDRKGINDAVFYIEPDINIREYIAQFGYVEADGTFSDISVLSAHWKIPSVNLSIGFWNEHRATEYLFLPALDYTVKRVKRMLKNPVGKFYPLENTEIELQSGYGYGYGYGWGLLDMEEEYDVDEILDNLIQYIHNNDIPIPYEYLHDIANDIADGIISMECTACDNPIWECTCDIPYILELYQDIYLDPDIANEGGWEC